VNVFAVQRVIMKSEFLLLYVGAFFIASGAEPSACRCCEDLEVRLRPVRNPKAIRGAV
jgi:hypothetical protein